MRVCTNHHSSWECVVFQYHLMDDSCSWFPEANMIFLRYRLQEVVNLFVAFHSCRKIVFYTLVGTNQVVAMHTCRHCHARFACIHKLEQSHLGGSILHSHTVGTEVYIRFATAEWFHIIVVEQVGVENFLCVCHRTAKHLLSSFYTARISVIK